MKGHRNTHANKQENSGENLLTVVEFCKRLGMSEHWGRKMLALKKLAVVRLGRSIRIPESELVRLVRENLRPPRKIA
jgi:excisionase family DNA binding protein